MINIENLVTPSPENFEVVIRGMRSPFKSWDKSDSGNKLTYEVTREDCYNCSSYYSDNKCYKKSGELCGLIIGKKDKQLLLNLCKAGDPSHRKVLRQLPVICDITAPEYFWRQLDQYKISTVTNSTSQMHTLLKDGFKPEDFSFDYLNESLAGKVDSSNIIDILNDLREVYLNTEDETDKKMLWHQILELIPQSINYTRTWSGNYEVLLNMIQQRRGHKLTEWTDFSNFMLEHVPYLKEIYEAVND